jgi:hypothetical protein
MPDSLQDPSVLAARASARQTDHFKQVDVDGSKVTMPVPVRNSCTDVVRQPCTHHPAQWGHEGRRACGREVGAPADVGAGFYCFLIKVRSPQAVVASSL